MCVNTQVCPYPVRTHPGADGRVGAKAHPPVRPTDRIKREERPEEKMMEKSKVEKIVEFFLPMEHVPTVTHQEKKVQVKNGSSSGLREYSQIILIMI